MSAATTFGRHEDDRVTRGVRLDDGTEIVTSVLKFPVNGLEEKMAIERMRLVADAFNVHHDTGMGPRDLLSKAVRS